MNLRQMILASLKRKHPDVNKSPTAERDTRALVVLLDREPEITRSKGMTREQAQEFLAAYNGPDNKR